MKGESLVLSIKSHTYEGSTHLIDKLENLTFIDNLEKQLFTEQAVEVSQ